MISRRIVLGFLASAVVTPVSATNRPAVTVYRSPSCGCCGAWAQYLRRAGFVVTIRNENDLTAVKRRAQVPEGLQSCHTAFIEGYVVEGHVPLEAIEKMLSSRPAILGIAVPDMPAGSPGMEVIEGKPEPFTVTSFARDGTQTVFLDYPNGFMLPR